MMPLIIDIAWRREGELLR